MRSACLHGSLPLRARSSPSVSPRSSSIATKGSPGPARMPAAWIDTSDGCESEASSFASSAQLGSAISGASSLSATSRKGVPS